MRVKPNDAVLVIGIPRDSFILVLVECGLHGYLRAAALVRETGTPLIASSGDPPAPPPMPQAVLGSLDGVDLKLNTEVEVQRSNGAWCPAVCIGIADSALQVSLGNKKTKRIPLAHLSTYLRIPKPEQSYTIISPEVSREKEPPLKRQRTKSMEETYPKGTRVQVLRTSGKWSPSIVAGVEGGKLVIDVIGEVIVKKLLERQLKDYVRMEPVPVGNHGSSHSTARRQGDARQRTNTPPPRGTAADEIMILDDDIMRLTPSLSSEDSDGGVDTAYGGSGW